jgi:hypothetical protein
MFFFSSNVHLFDFVWGITNLFSFSLHHTKPNEKGRKKKRQILFLKGDRNKDFSVFDEPNKKLGKYFFSRKDIIEQQQPHP